MDYVANNLLMGFGVWFSMILFGLIVFYFLIESSKS